MKENKDYYVELDKAIQEYENYKPYHTKTMDWICNKLDWCNKWKKLSTEQVDELANRIVNYLER